jgi:hypothetical protein
MTRPADQQSRDRRPPQSLLSEAIEQAGDTVRLLLNGLQGFAESEADALADREYGLAELATAPVRLFSVLVNSAFHAASTLSDNLALLSLDGRPAELEPRTVPVYLGGPRHPAAVTFTTSALDGEATGHRIRREQVAASTEWLAAYGVVTVVVRPGSAPPDIYKGVLSVTDSATGRRRDFEFLIAITELGTRLT